MSDEELSWFEGTSVGEHLKSTSNLGAEERRKQLVDGYFKKYFHWFVEAPGGGRINSDRLVEWALSMVHTRQWTRQLYPRTDRVPFLKRHLLLYPPALKSPNDLTSEDGTDSTTAAGGGGCEFNNELNPLMDLLNHHNDGYFIWEEPTRITIAAHRHYYPGEEVYLSYGAKSSTEKFLWYGWLDDPNDVVLDLSIETHLQPFFLQQQQVRSSSTLQVLREDLLHRLGSSMTYNFKATVFSKEDIGSLMESLCILTLNEDDISQILRLSLETVSDIINEEEEQQQEGVLTRREDMTESLLGVITSRESPNCLSDSNRERTLSFLHNFLISKSKSQSNEDDNQTSTGTIPSVSSSYFKNAANFFKRAERNIYHSLLQHILETPPLYNNPPLSSYPDPIIDDVFLV
jgi:hypothetical protein